MGRTTRVLTEGVYFGEGPRWREGRLWFSDFYAHAVKSVSLTGDLRTEVEIDDQPSGLGWQPDGSLLIVSMTKRQVLRRSPDGRIAIHADLSHIATYHCNDMVVDSAGGAYVGNFGFNLDDEIAARGVPDVLANHPTAKLAYVAPDGQTRVAAEDMHFPNGPVITPDGICLDAEGAIWVANPIAPECVRIAQGGEVLEVIETGQPCYACMLGGDDGRTLFMLTAASSDHGQAAASQTGEVLIATVESPHAGRP